MEAIKKSDSTINEVHHKAIGAFLDSFKEFGHDEQVEVFDIIKKEVLSIRSFEHESLYTQLDRAKATLSNHINGTDAMFPERAADKAESA